VAGFRGCDALQRERHICPSLRGNIASGVYVQVKSPVFFRATCPPTFLPHPSQVVAQSNVTSLSLPTECHLYFLASKIFVALWRHFSQTQLFPTHTQDNQNLSISQQFITVVP
jgi:hypothetical protein